MPKLEKVICCSLWREWEGRKGGAMKGGLH